MTPAPCVFCEIVAGRAPATLLATFPDSIVIEPLGPVVEGHALVIPRQHVEDARASADITGRTFADAVIYVDHLSSPRNVLTATGFKTLSIEDFNLITSTGANATQTVFHLHVHIVPRWADDRLPLPWTKVPSVLITEKIDAPTEAKVWRDGVLVFDGVDRSAILLAKKPPHEHLWGPPRALGQPGEECSCRAIRYKGKVTEPMRLDA